MTEKAQAAPSEKKHTSEKETPSMRIERIEETGELTKEDVRFFIELGIAKLPRAEKGTKLVPGGERVNKKYRIEYIKDSLGIDIDKLPGPISKRLVADVIFDLITMCQTIVHELETGESPGLFIEIFNDTMRLRRRKGEAKLKKLKSGKKAKGAGLEWQYSPCRSDNPTLPGEYSAILQEVYMALERKKETTGKQI